jgi:tetratricopeptide (TPR) repeat protein
MTGRRTSSSDAGSEETLADVVRALRKSVGETQKVFAKRFPVARTYISNTERGELVVAGFMEQLVDEFRHEDARIRAAYEVSLGRKPQPRGRQRETAIQRKIETFIRTGRFTYARRALTEGLNDVRDERDRHWMYERLAATLMALDRENEAIEALEAAIACASSAGLRDEEISTRDRYASYYHRRAAFPAAHNVVDVGLRHFPDAALLWLRKGKVHWYEQAYSLAYAALTTALRHGSPRQSVVHARGQVLAEWGSFEAALVDLDEYLAGADVRIVNAASVRSARAYIWGQTGRMSDALAEFDAVERIKPDSPWLYYRRALCYVKAGQLKPAAKDLVRALTSEGPRLNPPRREHATALLQEWGVTVELAEPPFVPGL